VNIIEAIKDEGLFRPFLGQDLTSWSVWKHCLRAVYGLPIKSARGREALRTVTGRDHFNPDGYTQSLFLTGRRSGKSRISAVVGAYEAALSGREMRLAKGEIGMVAILSPSKHQSNIVKTYLRSIFDTPLLRKQVVNETKMGFELRNGVHIGILAGDWRTVRGFSLLAAIVDEVCFFGLDAESHVKSDTELINAILPGLATTGGRLVAISSPYAKKGWAYKQHKRCFGNDGADTLVVNAPSRTMNPTLSRRIVDAALAEDMAAAKAEYGGEFRDDVGVWLSRDVIERLVIPGREELLPEERVRYVAFVDVSGGRGDDSALAIAHREDRKVVIDRLVVWKAPHDPAEVIDEMVEEMRFYRVKRITGDNYAAEFVSRGFQANGVRYEKSEKNKSELYMELLPRLCSGDVELLDHKKLIDQLAALERRTRSGGRDIVDHPRGEHDDAANVVAGVVECAAVNKRLKVGAAFSD
jgi:hypothetical protein